MSLRPRTPVLFNRQAWIVSVLSVAICALTSWREGTFTSRTVTIGFVNHGGMWGDVMILPFVNGLIVPHLPRITTRRIVLASGLFACALLVTIIAHEQWALIGEALDTTDHVFPKHSAGIWYGDLSGAGYLHVLYMSAELTLLFGYAVVLMPRETIVFVSALLTIHSILGQVQPAWYSTGTFLTTRTFVPTFSAVLLIWFVALRKLLARSQRTR